MRSIARATDISDIGFVVNFDLPNTIDDYVHRIGRTARGDRHGTAYSIFSTTDSAELARDLVKVLRESGQEVDPMLERYAQSRGGGGGGGKRGYKSRGCK